MEPKYGSCLFSNTGQAWSTAKVLKIERNESTFKKRPRTMLHLALHTACVEFNVRALQLPHPTDPTSPTDMFAFVRSVHSLSIVWSVSADGSDSCQKP